MNKTGSFSSNVSKPDQGEVILLSMLMSAHLLQQVGQVVQVSATGSHPRILWREDRHLLCLARFQSLNTCNSYSTKTIYIPEIKNKLQDFTRPGSFLPPWWDSWFSSTASSHLTRTSAPRKCAVMRLKSKCF